METKRKVGLGFILLCILVPVIPMAICIKRSIDGDEGNGVLVTIERQLKNDKMVSIINDVLH